VTVKKAPPALPTFARFAWRQFTQAGEIRKSFPALKSFAAIAPALRLLPAESGPRVVELDLLASDAGWRSSGLTVKRGQGITVFADGAVWIAKALGVGATPATAMWLRIGGMGPLSKMSANATSFEAWADGELEFCLKPPGEFLNEDGEFDPEVPRKGASGKVVVVVALWQGDAASGMAAFERVTGLRGLVTAETPPPKGWHNLWRLGGGPIYRDGECDGRHCIKVHTHGDVGILQYPIELPLTDDVQLEWRWRVDRLPSTLPEHIQPTHDYLSIAVEYDNGQDLTYYWSSSLPVGTVFKCPLPWWSTRETHWVVRSGEAELKQWQSEARPLRADYIAAIPGQVPERIVKVWLIANSVFQRGHGEAMFSDIALVSGGTRHRIA
jgi:hypothetical protein